MPYRIAAPPDPDPPETDDPFVAVLRSQERRTRIGAAAAFVIAAGLVAVTAFVPRSHAKANAPSIAERMQSARAAVSRAREHAVSEQMRFQSTVRAAIDQDAHTDICAVDLPKPRGTLHGPHFPMLVVDRDDPDATLPSRSVADVLVDVGRAEKQIAGGRYEEAALYARALETKDRLRLEVVVVATKHTRPIATGPGTFQKGEIAGRAYVYDFARGAVVCAVDVEAKSGESIDYAFVARPDAPPSSGALASLTDSLERDLDLRLADAVASRSGNP